MTDGDISLVLDSGTASDLVTLEQVRSFLQKETVSTSQDEEIEAMITRASTAISSSTEREFVPETTEQRTLEGYYGSKGLFVDVAPYDLQSVTALQLDTDQTSPIDLPAAQYRLGPLPAKYGVYTHIRLLPLSRALGPIVFPQVQVKVTGTWGFPSVPEDVQMACLITVATWMRREVQTFERVLSIDQGTLERPLGIPSAAMGLLAPFKRMAI